MPAGAPSTTGGVTGHGRHPLGEEQDVARSARLDRELQDLEVGAIARGPPWGRTPAVRTPLRQGSLWEVPGFLVRVRRELQRPHCLLRHRQEARRHPGARPDALLLGVGAAAAAGARAADPPGGGEAPERLGRCGHGARGGSCGASSDLARARARPFGWARASVGRILWSWVLALFLSPSWHSALRWGARRSGQSFVHLCPAALPAWQAFAHRSHRRQGSGAGTPPTVSSGMRWAAFFGHCATSGAIFPLRRGVA